MSKKRRTFSAEFKTKIVLSLLSEKTSMAQICKKHKLKDAMVSRWKKEFLEKAPQVFNSKSGITDEQSEKIE